MCSDFSSIPRTLGATPIRDLGLSIEGTQLEPIIAEFKQELARAGIRRLQPHFYLSTEWGVPFDTISIAIPFYLATPELTALHAERHGHVEGDSPRDILRYLRHEMGHVVNYAYRLYDDAEWIAHFGSIAEPYTEHYRPEPFSRRFVQHLPGWYAQKHPDEDWSETFAVWMTPARDWREDYASWPEALAKLNYCARAMQAVSDRDPLVTTTELDDDVARLSYSLDQYYEAMVEESLHAPADLDSALRAIFDDAQAAPAQAAETQRAAADLIRRLERHLLADVYRWTGHFPERTRLLLRHMAGRAAALDLVYAAADEPAKTVAITALTTALAMHEVLLNAQG
jgi:hypothetical protein